jgi:hypothetical protein
MVVQREDNEDKVGSSRNQHLIPLFTSFFVYLEVRFDRRRVMLFDFEKPEEAK